MWHAHWESDCPTWLSPLSINLSFPSWHVIRGTIVLFLIVPSQKTYISHASGCTRKWRILERVWKGGKKGGKNLSTCFSLLTPHEWREIRSTKRKSRKVEMAVSRHFGERLLLTQKDKVDWRKLRATGFAIVLQGQEDLLNFCGPHVNQPYPFQPSLLIHISWFSNINLLVLNRPLHWLTRKKNPIAVGI